MIPILNNLFGGFGQGKARQRFPRVYGKSDFGLTADVVCVSAKWSKVGEVTVPAQQELTYGVTEIINGGTTGHPCYLRLDDTSGQLTGKIRFYLSDANEVNKRLVLEESTARLSSSASDRTTAVLLNEFAGTVGEDSKLIVEYYNDMGASKTVDFDDADTIFSIPVTVYM